MATLELWLVRHGETVYNEARQLAGWSDVALTPRGRAQARALRVRLDGEAFDGVWSSDLQRTIHTARLAYGEPTPDARLREIDFGDLEATAWADLDPTVRDTLLGWEGFTAPGGEGTAALADRARAFVAELPPGRHLVFAHGGVIRALLRDRGLDRFVSPCTLVAVDWTAGAIRFEWPGEELVLDEGA